MGMLKKPPACAFRTQTGQRHSRRVADLRAHRRAALRGVRAHVRSVRSARHNGCGLPFDSAQGRAGRTLRQNSGQAFLNIPSRC